MIYKRFTILTIIRILLIAANMVVIASIFGDERLFFNQLILGFILILQIIELIRFVNLTNRELSKFIVSIQQSDFTIGFSKDELGKSFKGLFDSMRMMLDVYKKIKIEKEAQFHLLQQIISHVPVGIIVLRSENEIELMNDGARKILAIPEYKTWNNISVKSPAFSEVVDSLPRGRFLQMIELNGTESQLSLDISEFKMLENKYKLITFSDIKSEIEENEINAWHKLIRILTHEIMNSVTPISSLSETMQLMLEDDTGHAKNLMDIDNQIISDVLFSTKTIKKRSEGLLEFVEDYRKLTRIPKPEIQPVNIYEMTLDLSKLISQELTKEQISLSIDVPGDFEIDLDRNLITQILINLAKNSIESLKLSSIDNKKIVISVKTDGDHKIIYHTDNGGGIDKKDMENIWVPFFTTKKEGSGIGLSLSRQIMKDHGGKIWVNSIPDKETTFLMAFRK